MCLSISSIKVVHKATASDFIPANKKPVRRQAALVVHSLTIPPISFHQTENRHESSNKVLLNANRNTNERQSHNTNLIKRKNCKEKDKLGLYQYDRVQEIDMLLIIGFE